MLTHATVSSSIKNLLASQASKLLPLQGLSCQLKRSSVFSGTTTLVPTQQERSVQSMKNMEKDAYAILAICVNAGQTKSMGKMVFKMPTTPFRYQGALGFINTPNHSMFSIQKDGGAKLNEEYVKPYQLLQAVKTLGCNPAMLQNHLASDTSGFLSKMHHLARLDNSENQNLAQLLKIQPPIADVSARHVSLAEQKSSVYQQFMDLVAKDNHKALRKIHITEQTATAEKPRNYQGALDFLNPANSGGLIREKNGYHKFAKGETGKHWAQAAKTLHTLLQIGCDPQQVQAHYQNDTSGGLQKLQVLANIELANNASLSQEAKKCLESIVQIGSGRVDSDSTVYPTLSSQPAASAPPAYQE